MKRRLLLVIFGALLVFTRFFNLENTTRFIWDESSDLVRLHQIYVDRKLTLVGPISEDNSKVFGSLAYYLSLPFAVLHNFDPLSPVFGTVMGGLITAVGLLVIFKQIGPKRSLGFWLVGGAIVLGWFPLLQSSRAGLWAWHVSYIPMWQTLGLLFYLRATKYSYLLAGFSLGLTVHHHYLAAFATLAFCLARRWRDMVWLLAGLTLALLPFVIFDLRHPPGLFLTKLLYSRPVETQLTLAIAFEKFRYLFTSLMFFFTNNHGGAVVLGAGTVGLLTWDLVRRSHALIWAAGWIGQLLGLIFITNDGVSIHYSLPAAVFYLIWLVIPRQNFGKYVASGCLLILATTSVIGLKSQLTTTSWKTNIPLVRTATSAIYNEITAAKLQNVNLAVLASDDNNVYGRRYRDVLLVREIRLRTKDEYQYTDNLFVISQALESTIRVDPAYEMHNFRQGKLVKEWQLNREWKMYLFNRSPR